MSKSVDDCIAKIVEAAGGEDKLSKREAAELLRKFNDTTKHLPLSQRIDSLDAIVSEMRDNMIRRNEVFDVHAKQTELMHQLKLQQAETRVKTAIQTAVEKLPNKIGKVLLGETPVKKAFDTLLYGRPGMRDGLVHHYEGVRARFNTGLSASLEAQGLLEHWHDKDTLSSAVDVAFDPSAKGVTPEAQAIGSILRDMYKLSVARLNKAGAYVLPSPRVLFNSKGADMAKVRAMGKQGFVDFVRNLELDDKMFRGMEDAEIEDYFERLYDRLASGDQYKAPVGTFDGVAGLTKSKFDNLASRNSLDIDVPFATAAAYKQFMTAFSDEPLSAIIARRVDQVGRAVGLMEAFGPAPERMLGDLYARMEGQMTPEDKSFLLRKGYDPFTSKRNTAQTILTAPAKVANRFFLDAHPDDALSHMMGANAAPVDIGAARMGAGLRAWASMASLPFGVFAQLTDIPIRISQLIKLGKNPFDALVSPVTMIGELFPSAERKLFYARLGMAADQMLHTLSANAGEGGEGMSRVLDTYFKINGMAWPDLMGKRFTASYVSSNLAAALQDGSGHVLEHFRSYGFTDADFAKLKQAAGTVDGMAVIDPAKLQQVDDKLYEKYLGAMLDTINTATPTPGVRERAISQKGTRPGTWDGEALRIGMQFKNYPTMILTRVYPNIYYEHGIAGTLTTMVSMLAFWYMGDSLKALSQGKTPRDLTKPGQLQEAMIRSGFGGIFGDLVGNDYTRNGMSLADVLAGPATGRIGDVLELASATAQGKATPGLFAKKANRMMPNVHLGKTILEHSLIYGILEMSDPGSVQQSYDRIKERTGQERLF